jgi:4-amino-4-deoxy-L-arabinose transferase-like glycosyltransferase
MYSWDESSYSLNAQEMLEKGNPIEVYLLGKPDLFNSKPPFAIWCMAVCIKLFGFNEVGVRMASAIFGLLSALVLWLVAARILKNYWAALTLPLVLISSYGYVGWHVTRTADTDSCLVFWILLQCILVFAYTDTGSAKKANRYLLLAGFAVAFGCLTKGIAGLTALPGIVAWLIYTRKLKEVFTKKEFYLGLLSFLFLVIGYYWLRNKLTPGYFEAVWEFEIGGRLSRQDFLNQKTLPWYFYFEYMVIKGQERFLGWIFVLPVSIIYIFTRPADRLKQLGIFFIFIFTGISILLALSRTKLEWYDAPLYPLMAGIIGVSFCLFFKQTSPGFAVLFIGFFCWPYYRVVSNSMNAGGTSIGYFLQEIRHDWHEKDRIHIINSDINFPLAFYSKKDCLEGHYSDVVNAYDSVLVPGDYIITEKAERDFEVNRAFVLLPLRRYKECIFYQIVSKKPGF